MAPAAPKKQTRSQTAPKVAVNSHETPKISLNYAKTTKGTGASTSKDSQDEGTDLLLDAADEDVADEEEPAALRKTASKKPTPYKTALPEKILLQKLASKSHVVNQSEKNKEALNNLLQTMVEEEMQRQLQALDTSEGSSLPKTATVFAKYLFLAPGQGATTNAMWMEKSMERIRRIPMEIALQNGIATQIQEAMIETIQRQTALTAYQIGKDAVNIIKHLKQ